LLYRHIHEIPKPVAELRPDVPAHLGDAVAIALAKEPTNRFATMEEFARALSGDLTVRAAWPSGVTTAVARPEPVRKRQATVRAFAAAAAVAALVVAGVWLVPLAPHTSSPSASSPPPAAVADSSPASSPDSAPVVPQGRAEQQPASSAIVPLGAGDLCRARGGRDGSRPKRGTITVDGASPIRGTYVLAPGGTPGVARGGERWCWRCTPRHRWDHTRAAARRWEAPSQRI